MQNILGHLAAFWDTNIKLDHYLLLLSNIFQMDKKFKQKKNEVIKYIGKFPQYQCEKGFLSLIQIPEVIKERSDTF